jgi:hypothetical protein
VIDRKWQKRPLQRGEIRQTTLKRRSINKTRSNLHPLTGADVVMWCVVFCVLQERREKAVKWVDKEVRKLIGFLQKMGRSTTFGQLFNATSQEFEALSGTLVAARKKGAVQFEGAMLMMVRLSSRACCLCRPI